MRLQRRQTLLRQRQGGRLSTNTTRRTTPPTPPIIPIIPPPLTMDLQGLLGEEGVGEEEVLADDGDDGDEVEHLLLMIMLIVARVSFGIAGSVI